MLVHIPHGLDDIIHTFGSLDEPDFEQNNIVLFDLPYPLRYDDKAVNRSRCHRLVVDNFVNVFTALEAAGFADQVTNYSGIYNPRSMRGRSAHPSTHSWGIAIDLEAETYPLGSPKRFPDPIVEIFREHGFYYGGDFRYRKDPMHFQLCTGY